MTGGFTELYRQLEPVIGDLERERREVAARLVVFGAVTVLAAVLLVALVPAVRDPGLLGFVAFAGIAALGVAHGALTRRYRARFKNELVRRLVQHLGPGLEYRPEAGVGYGSYRSSQLFPREPDRYKEEDLIAGRVGQTRLKVSEVHSEYKTESTDSKGRRTTHWHTIFRGLFFVLDFPKPFRGTTLVLPDNGDGAFLNFLERFSSRGQLVKLEDPEFERYFVTYASDQVEARYLLSTSLMQRLVNFRKAFKRPLYLAFSGGNFYLALSTPKNFFEPRIFQPLRLEDLVDYLTDLRFVLSVIDELNLNTRIWGT
ncbi:hypothetical protein Mterra_02019 [Calidithermus terrae]|uniref:Galanin n=1 Tax=Calidithermus terrae TaxID=1408545 RepID=A0A399EKX9_9DEIN|nr:DUF3137 domain-containing protein [Calidithermus terrae]RIH84296.1 hypothetical protein Mterra_02019 [Calidithermus terrae]